MRGRETTMRKFITYGDRVLQVHLPRVLVETAVTQGASRALLFKDTELSEQMLTSPDMRISYFQFGMLIRNALELTGNSALGLDVGRNTGVAQTGMTGFLVQQSPSLRAAMQAVIRFSSLLAPGWDFSIAENGPIATLTVSEGIPMGPFRVFATDMVLASFDTQARALSKHIIPVRRIRLPFPEPPHSAEYRRQFYDVDVDYEEPVASIDFDSAFLDEVVAFADPAAAKIAEQFCALQVPPELSSDGLVTQVKRLLTNAIGVPPSLEDLAKTLQTSTRSLRRELGRMHTSYKDLLEESRKLRAEEWVKTNSMPLDRLAATLGFSHVRSFRRAFKRWTGQTPGSVRARDH
jgi:AraC-like DNA-binding protein